MPVWNRYEPLFPEYATVTYIEWRLRGDSEDGRMKNHLLAYLRVHPYGPVEVSIAMTLGYPEPFDRLEDAMAYAEATVALWRKP